MLTSLSKHRLLNTASRIPSLQNFSEFELYMSQKGSVVTQYYLVPKGWQTSGARVEPLAHIHVTGSGKIKLKTFQPEMYGSTYTETKLLIEFFSSLH